MSRRIEIELTSQRSPEEWTWRAAGAKLPKGSLPASVLYSGAKVGDVARAEAEFEIEGITITSVSAPTGKKGQAAPKNLLEIKGSGKGDDKLVTQQLVEKKDRPRGPRRDFGDRDSRPGGGRPGGPGGRTGGPGGRPGAPSSAGGRPPRPEGDRPRGGSSDRPRRERPPRPEAPTFKKLMPKDDNRRVVLDALEPQFRPIAEQLLRGGIPAVRQAIEQENIKAKAEDRPELNSPALLAMAEEIMPKLKAADWMDKATAAKAQAG